MLAEAIEPERVRNPLFVMPNTTQEIADLAIWRGKNLSSLSQVAVVVMSTNSDLRTIEAVKSILEQDAPAEIVVVNTGAGSLKGALSAVLDQITLVETSARQFAGGTRNLGIRFSGAPIVAFLAADCLVTPGWVRRRQEAHREFVAVASSLRPAPDPNGRISNVSWASYVVTHYRRMPEIPPSQASRFGVSYDRRLFSKIGLFNEEVRIGEDNLFNDALKGIEAPEWEPKIITLHRYPETLWGGITDQFRRGRRHAKFHGNDRYGRTMESVRNIKDAVRLSLVISRRGVYDLPPEVVRNRWLAVMLSVVRSSGMLIPDRKDAV